MAKYSIKDFQVSDTVYHLSNTKLTMVVVKITPEKNEISCRWFDKDGNTQLVEFMPEELGKADDLRPRVFYRESLP